MGCPDKVYTPEYGSEEPCNPTSAGCVVFENAITFLNLDENTTAEEVVTNLILYIQTQNIKINDLTNRIETLENE